MKRPYETLIRSHLDQSGRSSKWSRKHKQAAKTKAYTHGDKSE